MPSKFYRTRWAVSGAAVLAHVGPIQEQERLPNGERRGCLYLIKSTAKNQSV